MNRIQVVGLAVAAMLAAPGALTPVAAGGESVVVVPAREGVVKLGFDIAALRGAILISYQMPTGGEGQPVMHIWNVDAKAWKPLSLDEYSFGQFFTTDPDRIYLVGPDAAVPAVVVAGAEQVGCPVVRIGTLGAAGALNEFHKTMKFSWREWQALSKRHGVAVEDQNEARRRWGRYGPPKKASDAKPEPANGASATDGKSEGAVAGEATESLAEGEESLAPVVEQAPVPEPAVETVAPADPSVEPVVEAPPPVDDRREPAKPDVVMSADEK